MVYQVSLLIAQGSLHQTPQRRRLQCMAKGLLEGPVVVSNKLNNISTLYFANALAVCLATAWPGAVAGNFHENITQTLFPAASDNPCFQHGCSKKRALRCHCVVRALLCPWQKTPLTLRSLHWPPKAQTCHFLSLVLFVYRQWRQELRHTGGQAQCTGPLWPTGQYHAAVS
jgi:hypothetical protein